MHVTGRESIETMWTDVYKYPDAQLTCLRAVHDLVSKTLRDGLDVSYSQISVSRFRPSNYPLLPPCLMLQFHCSAARRLQVFELIVIRNGECLSMRFLGVEWFNEVT